MPDDMLTPLTPSTESTDDRLRESEARFRALFGAIDEGYCLCEIVLDGDGQPVDYRFLEVNPLFEDMTGLHDPVGKTAYELVPDLEAAWLETYTRVALGGEHLRFEQGSDAMGRWFDVFAMPVEPTGRFVVVFKDQTLRRHHDRALQQSEALFRTIADNTPMLIWIEDEHGAMEFVNPALRRFTGVAASETGEVTWRLVTHPDDESAYERTMSDAVAEQREAHGEVRAQRSDGEWRWLEFWAQPRLSETGSFLGYLGMMADVTERVEAEVERDLARQRAAIQQRLSAKLAAALMPHDVISVATEFLLSAFDVDRVAVGTRTPGNLQLFSLKRAAFTEPLREVLPIDSEHPAAVAAVTGERVERYRGLNLPRDDSPAGPAEAHEALPEDFESSVLFIPLDSGMGSLGLGRLEHRMFTEADRKLLAATVTQVSAALERARLHGIAEHKRERAELLTEVLTAIETVDGVKSRAERLLTVLIPRFADYGSIEAPYQVQSVLALIHSDPEKLPVLRTLREHHRLTAGQPNSMARAADGEHQLIERIDANDRVVVNAEAKELLDALAPLSHIAVPLSLGGGINGAIMLGISDPDRGPFSDDDRHFAADLAERAGLVLTAARLREAEHDIAIRLQQALLPDELVTDDRVRMCARYVAAGALLQVGGDWYDTFKWDDGQIGVIVGDVVGHGLESAAVMGRLRSVVAALAPHIGPRPAALLDALAQFMAGPNGADYTTACCMVLNPDTGTLTYASAGHPPALLRTPDGTTHWLAEAQTPPICGLPATTRTSASIVLEPGALIILYSDGLVERRRELIDVGLQRLEHSVAVLAADGLDDMADRLAAALVGPDTGYVPDDDVVVVALHYLGSGTP